MMHPSLGFEIQLPIGYERRNGSRKEAPTPEDQEQLESDDLLREILKDARVQTKLRNNIPSVAIFFALLVVIGIVLPLLLETGGQGERGRHLGQSVYVKPSDITNLKTCF